MFVIVKSSKIYTIAKWIRNKMIRDDGQLKILLLDSNSSTSKLLIKVLENNFENVNVLQDSRAELAFTSIPIFRPEIIICDYSFPTSTCEIIMCQLKKFKGLVIIYCNDEADHIKKEIEIPDNIIIITKPHTLDVVSAIKEHQYANIKN